MELEALRLSKSASGIPTPNPIYWNSQ